MEKGKTDKTSNSRRKYEDIDLEKREDQKVSDVKEILHNEIQKAIDHHDQLERLENKADEQQRLAERFKRDAANLKTVMCLKKLKMALIIILIIGIIIAFIVGMVYVMKKN